MDEIGFELEVWYQGRCVGTRPVGARGLLLGRGSECDIVLQDPGVSKQHARVTRRANEIFLTDLQSTAGTFVDGKKVTATRLAVGGGFRVGPYELNVIQRAAAGSRTATGAGAQREDGELARMQKDLDDFSHLLAVTDVQALLESLLDRAMQVCGAAAGHVVLQQGASLSPVLTRRGPAGRTEDAISRTLCARALETCEPVSVDTRIRSADPHAADSIVARPESVLVAVPLVESGEALGVMYLEQPGANASKLDPERWRAIGTIGGKALRVAIQSQEIVLEPEGWRWTSSRLPDRPDLFVTCASAPMRHVMEVIRRAAAEDVTLLIQGETGTGKEVAAQSVHDLGRRRRGPFIALNCAALPRELIQAELFGYEKGAFTGAHEARPGKLEVANGGTLFLDEIGDMPLDLQTSLLRALESRTVVRLGGSRAIPWDGRVIAASHVDLAAAVERGEFRRDLYYRLNVVSIELPPLRGRVEDIELLTREILLRFNRKFNRKLHGVSPEALAVMQTYSWPGNVRELRNVIERAFFVEQGTVITPASLPFQKPRGDTQASPLPAAASLRLKVSDTEIITLEAFVTEQERRYIQLVLDRCQGNVTHTARLLGLSRVTLQRKMKQLGLRDTEDP